MDHQQKDTLNHVWREQIRQVAARNPRLAQQLWQNRREYHERFAYFYRQLAGLPRKYRRKFLRRLATTLAGLALLLALGQVLPARAATITVDGAVCTLAEAIMSANNDDAAGNGCVDGSGADVLDLQTDVTLSAPLPPINSEITLEGNGHTIQRTGGSGFSVLYVELIGEFTLNNAIITGGGGNRGGGIYNKGELTVNYSTISGNGASEGGGIFNHKLSTNVNNSIISGNSASDGGGIYSYKGGSVALNHSVVSGNSATRGGGIFTYRAWANINYSTVSENSATFAGGGIYSGFESAFLLNHSTLSGNSAFHGGGIFQHWYNWLGSSINFSRVSNNTALRGGGIFNDSCCSFGGKVSLNNTTLSGNTASINGGGIFNNGSLYDMDIADGKVYLSNSTLSGNSATMHGGGIWNWGRATLDNSTLTGNSADLGGGIYNYDYYYSDYYQDPGTVNLNRSLVSGNSAGTGDELHANNTAVNANNFNVFGYGGDDRSYGFIPGPNDIIPPGALNTVLDTTLANNGGPTFTHALVSGSVAIDAAPDTACLAPPINGVDQRGFPRNVDGNGSPSADECDAGAFEFTPRVRPTKTPAPTGMPQPTRTPTPRPTRTPTQTPSPLGPNQGASSSTGSADESANALVRFVTVPLLTLGSLLLFRKWHA